jgi:hypothetical protein
MWTFHTYNLKKTSKTVQIRQDISGNSDIYQACGCLKNKSSWKFLGDI